MSSQESSGDRTVRRKTFVKAFNLQPPASFLPTHGDPRVPWYEWKEYWSNYMGMVADEDMSPEDKKGVLLHALGAEGHRIFMKLPRLSAEEVAIEDDPYTMALKQLDKRFDPKVNLAVNRHSFYTRGQRSGETIDDYVAALR